MAVQSHCICARSRGRGDQKEANEIIVVYAKNKLIVNLLNLLFDSRLYI